MPNNPFQTPSAGRWVLQRDLRESGRQGHQVSNPISGEVGAAAAAVMTAADAVNKMFQTPSAGRWVLQPEVADEVEGLGIQFQTPSAGRWVLQHLYSTNCRGIMG